MERSLLNEVTSVKGKVSLIEKDEIVENEAIVITPFAWKYRSWNYRYFKQSNVGLADRIVITLLAATLGSAAGLAA